MVRHLGKQERGQEGGLQAGTNYEARESSVKKRQAALETPMALPVCVRHPWALTQKVQPPGGVMCPTTPESLSWVTQLANSWVKIPNQTWPTLCPKPMALIRPNPQGHSLG